MGLTRRRGLRLRRLGGGQRGGRAVDAVAAVRAAPCSFSCLDSERGGGDRNRSGGNRTFVGAGEDGDAAILLDAHGHFRADEIEAFGAHMAAQQAHAGDADLGLRRTRHHRAVGVAHDDVADAHGRAAVLGALDLSAADFDVMAAAEILLDGGSEPGRDDVELNGSAGKPPPQSEAARRHQRHRDANPDPGAPQEAPVASEEAARAVRAAPRRADVPLRQSRSSAPVDAGERPCPLAEAPRSACPGSSCPFGRPLVRGAFRTIRRQATPLSRSRNSPVHACHPDTNFGSRDTNKLMIFGWFSDWKAPLARGQRPPSELQSPILAYEAEIRRR